MNWFQKLMKKIKNLFRKKRNYEGFRFYADWAYEELPDNLEQLDAMADFYYEHNYKHPTGDIGYHSEYRLFELHRKRYEVAKAAGNVEVMVSAAARLAYGYEFGRGTSRNEEKAFAFGIYAQKHHLLNSYNQKINSESKVNLVGMEWARHEAAVRHFQKVLDVTLMLAKKERQEGTLYYRGFYYLLGFLEFRKQGIEKAESAFDFEGELAKEGNPYALANYPYDENRKYSWEKVMQAARAGCYDCVLWAVEYGPAEKRDAMKAQLEEMNREARTYLEQLPEKITLDHFERAHARWYWNYVDVEQSRIQEAKYAEIRKRWMELERLYSLAVSGNSGDSASIQKKQQACLDYLSEMLPQNGKPDDNMPKLLHAALAYLERGEWVDKIPEFRSNLTSASQGDFDAVSSLYGSYRQYRHNQGDRIEARNDPILLALQMERVRMYTHRANRGDMEACYKLYLTCSTLPGGKEEARKWANKALQAEYPPMLYAAYLEYDSLGISQRKRMEYLRRAYELGEDSARDAAELMHLEHEQRRQRAEMITKYHNSRS